MRDRVRCCEAGIADDVTFATKGELARRMLTRVFEADIPTGWVAGDTVYGYDEIRLWLDEQGKNSVVAVPETHLIWMAGRHQPLGYVAALLPASAWRVISAGDGSKGPRLYEWAWLQLPHQADGERERARWVLIRRNLADPSQRAYYRAAGPASIQLADLVRVAGSRWKIEEGFEEAKGEVGLDQYEVRGFRAWYRFVTLALLAHAILAVVRTRANAQGKKSDLSLRVAEVRRLIQLLGRPEEQRERGFWWSRFRRQHQAGAKRCHWERRGRQAPAEDPRERSPIRLAGTFQLSDGQWEKIRALLPKYVYQTRRQVADPRLIIEAILWVMDTGSSWREIPNALVPGPAWLSAITDGAERGNGH